MGISFVRTWLLLWIRWEAIGRFWGEERHDLTCGSKITLATILRSDSRSLEPSQPLLQESKQNLTMVWTWTGIVRVVRSGRSLDIFWRETQQEFTAVWILVWEKARNQVWCWGLGLSNCKKRVAIKLHGGSWSQIKVLVGWSWGVNTEFGFGHAGFTCTGYPVEVAGRCSMWAGIQERSRLER